MTSGRIRTVSHIINCGFARVSIYENTPTQKGCLARQNIDSDNSARKFRAHFSNHPGYGIPENYFEPTGKDKRSQFERDSDKIISGFRKLKWPSGCEIDKDEYLSKFSSGKWSELPTKEKHMHTMSNCVRCYESYAQYQQVFPLKPFYQPNPIVQIDTDAIKRQGTKKFTSSIVSELDSVFTQQTNITFREALVKDKSYGLERKKTQYEKKKEKRELERKFTKQVNKSFAEKAAITLLSEGESKRKYHRKRLAQSFTTPENSQPLSKKPKKHSPNFSNVEWDKENVETTLRNWPTDVPINWSAVARNHGVKGGNGGQVVKDFAESLGLFTADTSTPSRKPRARASKTRLPGSSISIPSNPPVSAIEKEIQAMVESGKFTLGEPCAPYKLTRYIPLNGVLSPLEVTVMARKIPLTEIRKRLLSRQRMYMRLTPTTTIQEMTMSQLTDCITKYGGNVNGDMSHSELCELLCSYQRSRSLAMWHDHATILKMGFLMITIHTLYDPAVFLTDEEYKQKYPNHLPVSVQSEVEQPEVYMLSLGGSSVEDQAAVIGDRTDCLHDLSLPLDAGNEIKVRDKLRYFTGDHPAAQFEQGTKQGGTYKCGVCGCKDGLFDDQAHSLQYCWRNLHDLQSIAISGVFGREAGVITPFDNLKVDQLRTELQARGVEDTSMKKGVLRDMLDNILRGVMRVPALLLTDPTQTLTALNLSEYEVVASEPLHDLKGHIINLISELPFVLPEGNITAQCNHLISSCLAKEKKSGADLRRIIIQIFLLLKDLDCSSKVLALLQTIIKIGEILYSREEKRTPRQLLQLYNNCWLHMELCAEMFSSPKQITRTKMFGHYLHALTAHCPTQYELCCLRSLNTENQERLFGQARRIAETCTNHHAQNIIPQVMLRLQAKQEQRQTLASVESSDSQVGQIAKHLPQFPGTTIKFSFLRSRESSWQAHLVRISPFLSQGEGAWWETKSNGFLFRDGDTDNPSRSQPKLLHFREHNVGDVEQRQKSSWKKIIEDQVLIPANSIKLFDSCGNLTGRMVYSDKKVSYIPQLTSQETTSNFNGRPHITQDGAHSLSLIDKGPAGVYSPPLTQDGPHSLSLTDKGPAGVYSPPLTQDGAHSLSLVNKNPAGIYSPHLTQDGAHSLSLADDDQKMPTHLTHKPLQEVKKYHQITRLQIQEHSALGKMKTSLASSISEILNDKEETLTEFDELRFHMKEIKNKKQKDASTKEKILRYKSLAAQLGVKLLAKRTELDQKVKEFEYAYFAKHSTLPDRNNAAYNKLLSSRNHAKAALRNLNINL